MPRFVCSASARRHNSLRTYNSFVQRVPADGRTSNGPNLTPPSKKTVRFLELTENDNSVNEQMEQFSVNRRLGSVDMVDSFEDSMEPMYATVRKRNSPCKEQQRSVHVPQVPLNIQPGFQEEFRGYQPTEYRGFRPYAHTSAKGNRHFRQNTDLGISSYKVIYGFLRYNILKGNHSKSTDIFSFYFCSFKQDIN